MTDGALAWPDSIMCVAREVSPPAAAALKPLPSSANAFSIFPDTGENQIHLAEGSWPLQSSAHTRSTATGSQQGSGLSRVCSLADSNRS